MASKFKKVNEQIKKKPKVTLIRHGTTRLNNPDKNVDRIRGWQDIPLNDQGRDEAREAAKKIQGYDLDIIYSSDLSRAKETATIINENYHVPIVDSKDLRPWHLGIYEGKVSNEVHAELEAFIKNEDMIPTNGESFHHFRTRYLNTLCNIIDQAIKDSSTIIVTTHYRNLKLANAWIACGMDRNYDVNPKNVINYDCEPGEIYELPLDKYKG